METRGRSSPRATHRPSVNSYRIEANGNLPFDRWGTRSSSGGGCASLNDAKWAHLPSHAMPRGMNSLLSFYLRASHTYAEGPRRAEEQASTGLFLDHALHTLAGSQRSNINPFHTSESRFSNILLAKRRKIRDSFFKIDNGEWRHRLRTTV